MILWLKLGAVLFVSKDDIWVQVGVQVLEANVQLLNLTLESRCALSGRVIGTLSGLPVCSVAVNIHVGVLATVSCAMDEDCSVNVTAVGESGWTTTIGEAPLKRIAACPALCGV